QEDPGSPSTLAASVDSYRARGVARAALSQLQLVAGDQALWMPRRARVGPRFGHYITHRAGKGHDASSDDAEAAADAFIALAAVQVRATALSPVRLRHSRLVTGAIPLVVVRALLRPVEASLAPALTKYVRCADDLHGRDSS